MGDYFQKLAAPAVARSDATAAATRVRTWLQRFGAERLRSRRYRPRLPTGVRLAQSHGTPTRCSERTG